MRNNTISILATSIAFVFLFESCTKHGYVHRPIIENHPAAYVVDKTGRIVITATCPDGEKMIGGGYILPPFVENTVHKHKKLSDQWIDEGYYTWDDDATECDKNQAPLFVEASYPSSNKTWTVVIYNPDVEANCYHFGDLIQVNCYSVTNPRLALQMKINSLPPHPTNTSATEESMTEMCNCPPGSVVTAGGFKLDPLNEQNWDERHLPLKGSYPNVDENNKAIGWTSEYITTSNVSPALLTTYVLCSVPVEQFMINSKVPGSIPTPAPTIPGVLIDGPVKNSDQGNPPGDNISTGEILCDEGYFSSGGGFRAKYNHLVPPSATADPYVNGFRIPFAGWSFRNYGTHDASAYKWPSYNVVYTLQLKKLPENIEVSITNPADGIYLNKALIERRGVTFKGHAVDHDGTPITGNNLKWQITGASDGNGENYKATIDLNAGEQDNGSSVKRFTVKLTATSKEGDSESAYLYLYYKEVNK